MTGKNGRDKSLYERCLICRAPFPKTGISDHLPRGDRVAYDPNRGRLWMVCRACRSWSLVPMEERWEALEELESLLGGGKGGARQPKLLSETENVALFRVGQMEVLRIGGAGLAEEATWRYGQRFNERLGVWKKGPLVRTRLPRMPKMLRENGVVWRGRKRCPACNHLLTEIRYSDRNILVVRPGEESFSAPSLTRRCPKCRDADHGGLHLRGPEGGLILFRFLAFEHYTGAPIDRVQAAARMVLDPDGPATLVGILAKHGRPLGDIPPLGVLALEMVTNAAREETLLKLELAELTFRWRQEEELAALIDGDLTWSPGNLLEGLLKRMRG